MSNAIFDLGLNPNEIAIYAVLSRRADKRGLCYPSLARIGRDTGIKSENTIRKTLKSLMQKNLIRKTSRTVKGVAVFEVLTPSNIAGVTPSEFESAPPQEMRTEKDLKKKTHLLNREKPELCSGEKLLNNGVANCNSGDKSEAQKPNRNTLSDDKDKKISARGKDYSGEVETPPSQEMKSCDQPDSELERLYKNLDLAVLNRSDSVGAIAKRIFKKLPSPFVLPPVAEASRFYRLLENREPYMVLDVDGVSKRVRGGPYEDFMWAATQIRLRMGAGSGPAADSLCLRTYFGLVRLGAPKARIIRFMPELVEAGGLAC